MATIREEIISKLTIAEQKVTGKHDEKELEKAKSSQSILDQDVSTVSDPSRYDLVDFTTATSNVTLTTDAQNKEIFVDQAKIGDQTILVSCQKAANVVISQQREIQYVSAKMVVQTFNVDGSVESLQDGNLYRIPEKLRMNSKANVVEDQIIKEYPVLSFNLGCSMEVESMFEPNTFYSIQLCINALKSVMLSEVLTADLGMTKDDLFKTEIFITNNKTISSMVEKLVRANFIGYEDDQINEIKQGVMDLITNEFQIAPLTNNKLRFGINLSNISKSDNPNWTVEKGGRNFRSNGRNMMRIIQLRDTCSDIPILSTSIEKHSEKLKLIETAFLQWAENNARSMIGLEPIYTKIQIPTVEAVNKKISEVLSFSKEDSLSKRLAYMDNIKKFTGIQIDKIRSNITADNMSNIGR